MSGHAIAEKVACRANEIYEWLTDPVAGARWGTARALCGCSRCKDKSPRCCCGRNQFTFPGCEEHPCWYGCSLTPTGGAA